MTEIAKKPRLPRDHLPVIKAENADVDAVKFPDMGDLMARLHFSTSDGRIWLDDQRMLLIHAKAFGQLRRELIDSLGVETARGFMTRMGYYAGAHDAQMARKVRSTLTPRDMFVVGPQMHCLEGIGLSEPVRLEFDVERGTHYGEFVWTSQVEDEEHARHFGIGTEPMCWMQIGYASGYTTEFMGRPVLYREVECQSMGLPACRIVGKPVEEWGDDAADDLRVLRSATVGSGATSESIDAPYPASPKASPSTTTAFGDEDLVGVSPGFNSVCTWSGASRRRRQRCSFSAKAASARKCSRATCIARVQRSKAPFVALNCAALPEQLVEAELFGVERGAYTGASQSRLGRFERADGGTLFLDEIGILSMSAQGKLLRVLQEGEIERLGDVQTRHVSVRVIAATNLDLREEVKAGRFREDLFYRLNVFPIRIPPLRERREDIPILMNYFLSEIHAPSRSSPDRLHAARRRRHAHLRVAGQHSRDRERRGARRDPGNGRWRDRRRPSVHERRAIRQSPLRPESRRRVDGLGRGGGAGCAHRHRRGSRVPASE